MAVDGRKPYTIVPVVAPLSADPNTSGKVRNLHCGGGVCHRQLMGTNDGYEIHPVWHRKGWRLLRDMYAEEEGDDGPGWRLYQEYIRLWQAEKTRKPFPFSRLPKAVQERQRCLEADPFAEDNFRISPTTGALVEPPADAELQHAPAVKVKPQREARP